MAWLLFAMMGLGLSGLIGVYAWLVLDLSRGLERQRQHRLQLEARLRKKGIIK